jgi:integrase
VYVKWLVFKNSSQVFKEYADEYLTLKSAKARNSYLQAKFILEIHLLPVFGSKKVSQITELEIAKYLAQKSKNRKVYDHIKHLKGVLKLARKSGEAIPEFEIKCPDQKFSRGKVYKRSELARLLWNCRGFNRALALQIRMAYTMGMRRSEICHLKWEMLDLERGWVYLPAWFLKTKRTADRAFPINQGVLRILRKIRSRLPDNQFVFQMSSGKCLLRNTSSWQRLRLRAGIEGRFHDLRHTCATNMLRAGVAEIVVCKLLGMTKEVLERYAHVQEDVAKFAVNQSIRMAA